MHWIQSPVTNIPVFPFKTCYREIYIYKVAVFKKGQILTFSIVSAQNVGLHTNPLLTMGSKTQLKGRYKEGVMFCCEVTSFNPF